MITWVEVLPVSIFWGVAGFLSLKKTRYSETGTLFETQKWGLWLGPFAITIIFLMQVIAPKILWHFRENPIALTLLWTTEITCFAVMLFFLKTREEDFFAKLGFFYDQISFRFVSGLRWISGFYLIYTLFGYILLSRFTPDEFAQFILRYDSKEAN